ncbi:hypothetical protein [Pontivivens insulae]|uniref:HEPN domain-containing protein n=1 Tax=Pontivivens insulae TaxID=1639689 RepID=A0A2R8AAZ5_9RHOB|nr:hypothetical protein [Pontivivens insulae]RED13322.1 hypothetical protein DFR53_2458 [Pontivivens insulae]SPF29414.1 hypothetical protein POI8812_01722 [Pontivivens insulae]
MSDRYTIERLKEPDASERSPATAMLAKSEEFTKAALALVQGPGWMTTDVPHLIPTWFLVGHSWELAMKAAVRAEGETITQIREEFGHDIGKLKRWLSKRPKWQKILEHAQSASGLPSAEFDDLTSFLAAWHKANDVSRYVVTGYYQIPDPRPLLVAIETYQIRSRPLALSAYNEIS